jgi:hypothetical protein
VLAYPLQTLTVKQIYFVNIGTYPNSGEVSYAAATFIHDYYTRAAGPVFLLAYIHVGKGRLLGGARHPKKVSQNHLPFNNQIVMNLPINVMTKSGEYGLLQRYRTYVLWNKESNNSVCYFYEIHNDTLSSGGYELPVGTVYVRAKYMTKNQRH